MKRICFRLLTVMPVLVCCIALSAQSSVNDDYNRNSLTIIPLTHGDRYDQISVSYLESANPGGDKFDATRIGISSLRISESRFEIDDEELETPTKQATNHATNVSGKVADLLYDAHVSRILMGTWFNRGQNGLMDLHLINKRAEYNATDQTFNVANSQALGKYLLQSGGVELIKHSYILVVDHSVPVIERKYNDRGNVSDIKVCTYAMGNLYKLDIEDSDFQKVYDCWIYPDDSPEVKESKMKAWDRLNFTLWNIKNVGTLCLETQESSFGNSPDENALIESSITRCTSGLIDELEKSVSDWQVKSGIYKTNPVSAKIGKKEGLSNMDRYEVLEFMTDGYGHNYSRRRGWIRATKVVDNRKSTSGNSGLSEFYQIAGGNIEPGMQIHQKKSIGLDLKALYYAGKGFGYGLELDFAFGMKTNMGQVHHIKFGGLFSQYQKGFTANDEYELTDVLKLVDIRFGYGYGIRPIRYLELIPSLTLLADSYVENKDDDDTGDEQQESELVENLKFLDKTGWGISAGLDANINVFYPVKLTVGVYYDQLLFGGKTWDDVMDVLDKVGTKRSGLTFRAGLVYEF